MANETRESIGVIGGGFTGLVAALRLAQAGHAVEVFERGEVLGGLASGLELHGTNIERTYHHIFRADTEIIGLVNELGIADRLEWHESSVAIYRDGKMWPFMSPRDLLYFTPIPLMSRVRVGLVALYLQHQRQWQRFRGHTALAWMRARAGAAATHVIWEPLLRGKFDRYADEVSMAWLWARLHIRVNSRIPGEQVERLGYFNGGFNVIVQALRTELANRGARIHFGATVERIQGGDSPTVTIDGDTRKFSAVLATVPSHVFAALIRVDTRISDAYLRQLASIQYLGAMCLLFSSTQELGNAYWVSVNEPTAPFQVLINHTRLVDKARYEGRHVYYIGRYLPHDHPLFSQPADEIESLWFGYLKELFPHFDRSAVIEAYLTRLSNAQHVVDLGYEQRIPPYATPAKNVFLANFSQIFPADRGTSHAVGEGQRIAALINGTVHGFAASFVATPRP